MVALRLFILSTLLICSSPAQADVLFEGYSKIMLGGNHVGYAVSRYDFDVKKQEFVSTYFIRIETGEVKFSESLKARANSKLEPISYFFTRLDGEPAPAKPGSKTPPKTAAEVKTIDAYFQKNKMSAVVRENGQTKTIKKDLPKGAFLSTFLYYLILQSKEGLKVSDASLTFDAIAEEDASLTKGTAWVKSQQAYNGVDSYKVLNVFKDDNYISYVTPKGEIIATESPARKLSTQLVPDMKQAIGSLSFKTATLESLFGAVPKGKENVLARTSGEEIPAPPSKLNTNVLSTAPDATPEPKPIAESPSAAPAAPTPSPKSGTQKKQ